MGGDCSGLGVDGVVCDDETVPVAELEKSGALGSFGECVDRAKPAKHLHDFAASFVDEVGVDGLAIGEGNPVLTASGVGEWELVASDDAGECLLGMTAVFGGHGTRVTMGGVTVCLVRYLLKPRH